VELVVYAEANQFILCGEGAEASGDEEDKVSNAELAAHIAARPGELVVFTASYGRVSICLESLPAEPAEDIDSHDHVVDASLDCPEGQLLCGGRNRGARAAGRPNRNEPCPDRLGRHCERRPRPCGGALRATDHRASSPPTSDFRDAPICEPTLRERTVSPNTSP
jgi:hypothetical protein